MPIYEFQCSSCKAVFEENMSIHTTKDQYPKCRMCGHKPVQKLISTNNFHLKGSGWFKDGYSNHK